MKIGIVTFHSAHNYGAVLQAWSLQEYLKQQGHQVEIVNLRLPVIDNLYQLVGKTNKKVCFSEGINRLINSSYYRLRCLSARIKTPAKYEKFHKFEHFINHVLPVTRKFNSYLELVQANLKYDALIAGSDQIWNGKMMKDINPAYFLQFGNKDALRISYAASIGTETIPPQFRLMFQRYLRELDSISIREKKAKAEIESLTDQPVDLVADPTFLLKAEDFDRLARKPKVRGKYIYVHNVHLKRVDESLNSVASEMSRRLNLPIVHNWSKKVYENEKGHFTGGVEEFLGYVREAEYVITNSFHCTAFALIYKRDFITVPHFSNPDRMRNLLAELDLSDHLIDHGSKIPKNLKDLTIDYDKVEGKRDVMRTHARQFLEKALTTRKKPDNRTYFECSDVFRCYGCQACKDACPVGAIRMETDKEGFRYPKIDEEKCIHCDKCKRVCIYRQSSVKNPPADGLPEVYAARHRDDDAVWKSASGAAFPILYGEILKRGGAVVGVRYDDDLNVIYDLAETQEGCEAFRRSKYLFADSTDIKPKVEKLLKEGRYVLYSGTPCQIAGLKSYLGKSYSRLYTVDLICHGSGSPKVFQKYCEHMEHVYQSKITDFQFRNKFKGVDNPYILIEFASGSVFVEDMKRNNIGRAYRSNHMHRPSCYQCEYVGERMGVGDITIGDYWGIEEEHPQFADERGVSLIKINTVHGRELFECVKDQMKLQKSTYKQAYSHNYSRLMVMRCSRSKLMYYIDDVPIDDLLLTFNESKKGGLKGL
ncbi:MAG: polysaccharide pyruvyl transferase family protein [Ruminococcus sp.]|jgi:coenzyme F420-reducing hydrogenase beta subunit